MNLSNASTVTVRGKAVKQIDINGKTVWKAESRVWNLADRSVVTEKYVRTDTTSIAGILSEDNYINGIQCTGRYINSNSLATISNVTASGFTLQNSSGNYGIGVPYAIKTGETIILSLTKTANCQIFVAYYNAQGLLVSNKSLGNTGTSLNLSDTAETDGWAVLVFAPYQSNSSVTFSEMSLKIS